MGDEPRLSPGRRIIQMLESLLLPPACSLCGFPGMRAGFDLCHVCNGLLPRNPSRKAYPAPFSRVIVPFEYAYPVDRFIRALKFSGERRYARVLGVLLADVVSDFGGPLPQALIPVPLHSSRYRSRGFNQAFEIARFAARPLGVRVDSRHLLRLVPTREQSGLSLAERRRNVRGAFQSARPARFAHVALIDDVLTTGNTAAEAARALADAGTESIELWAVAHVTGHVDDDSAEAMP